MSMTDPIADMFTRIRNAQSAKHEIVLMPHSTVKESIAKVLKEEGYLNSVERVEATPGKPCLKIALRYVESKPVIDKIRRVSRPGLRQYVDRDKLPRVFGGYGIAIISTSKGMMSAKQARDQNLGGEVVGEVW